LGRAIKAQLGCRRDEGVKHDVPKISEREKRNYWRADIFRLMFNRMVEYSSRLLDRTFGALADPTRRQILAQLAKGGECVTDLARPHAMSLAAVSKHLIVLERAGLVKRQRKGRVHWLKLEAKPMQEAQAWIDRYRKFWEGNLDQFESYLDKLQTEETKQDDGE
jgi:DNA-binding transcriptional ArsR family regulator